MSSDPSRIFGNGIPEHAERVDFMAVCKLIERPSRYAFNVMAQVSVFECPACGGQNPDPGCNKTVRCKCGLSIQCTGAAVFIWPDAVPVAAE